MLSDERLDIRPWSLAKVALPVSLGIFVQFIVVFIDNYFVAQIDGNAMSAVAFVGLIYLTLAMIGVGLGNATQILIARRKGSGEYDAVGQVLGNAFALAFLVGVLQFALLFAAMPPLINAVIESPEVRAYMHEFITWRSIGFIVYTPLLVLDSFWSGIAKTRVLIYMTILTSLVTILLDYALVFGNFGFPKLGVEGAGIATVTAECCAFVFVIIYTWLYHNEDVHLELHTEGYAVKKNLFSMPKHHTQSLMKLGGPIALQMVLSLGIWTIFYEFVESMGESELQSSFIVRNMYSLVYVSVGGFSTTAKTYISGLIAEQRQSELLTAMKRLMLLNFLGIILMSHGLWLYPEWIAQQFTQDPVVIQQTVDTMLVVLPAMLVFSVTSIMLATVEGSGNTLAGFLVEMGTVIIYIASAYLMVFQWHWPIHLVWTADWVYFIVLGLFSLFFLWNGKWKWKKI
jgi:multidrug resistance protein, MATE family